MKLRVARLLSNIAFWLQGDRRHPDIALSLINKEHFKSWDTKLKKWRITTKETFRRLYDV